MTAMPCRFFRPAKKPRTSACCHPVRRRSAPRWRLGSAQQGEHLLLLGALSGAEAGRSAARSALSCNCFPRLHGWQPRVAHPTAHASRSLKTGSGLATTPARRRGASVAAAAASSAGTASSGKVQLSSFVIAAVLLPRALAALREPVRRARSPANSMRSHRPGRRRARTPGAARRPAPILAARGTLSPRRLAPAGSAWPYQAPRYTAGLHRRGGSASLLERPPARLYEKADRERPETAICCIRLLRDAHQPPGHE
jgi:hypothetical protein